MSINISTFPMQFYPITMHDFLVALGVAGWVDTDCSATTGVNVSKIWVIVAYNQGNELIVGARPNGSAIDNKFQMFNSATILTNVSTSGHIDFYRNATKDTHYQVIGYIR